MPPNERCGRAFYFGTFQRPGHYLWDDQWKSRHPWNREELAAVSPWGWPDGKVCPPMDVDDGVANIAHKDGWTIVAFRNRAWDSRASVNSAFLFDATLTFEEALAEARRRFPHVVEALPFEIVPAIPSEAPRG